MIRSAEEFVELRDKNDARATHDTAMTSVWMAVIRQYPEYKAWVIHNKTVPLSILRVLAHDTDSMVRYWVAMKRKCPPEILEELAQDEDESVRTRVALNAKTPGEILEMMRDDPCEEIAELVVKRLDES